MPHSSFGVSSARFRNRLGNVYRKLEWEGRQTDGTNQLTRQAVDLSIAGLRVDCALYGAVRQQAFVHARKEEP